ncbi:MAG: nucleotidyltransferase domain-containing protein [Candidatus Korarchaeota archaeon]|nr:nucleotidyltransferase domain-containing protein [Candidatus Korarchaeota archaeon]NIU84891.1 hypothetical protein [Candidatus Thorarchaeota archaeon]NIW14917.1 hypothetical protein [Candidatus Thorarchaeota archaeon]NIW52951.1 hypothetical protein [Candidatus Korarchaeota archaeon]
MNSEQIRYIRLTTDLRSRITSKIRKFAEIHKRIKLCFIFGSFLRRDRIRDVDVAIYPAPSLSFEELLRYGTKLELAIGKPVDLLSLRDISPAFRWKILRAGHLLFPPRKSNTYHQLVGATISQLHDFNTKKQHV